MFSFFVISLRKILLQPDVEDNEEIATTHLADLQFGYPRAAVAPGDGDDRKIVAADDGLEGEFDGDVEMW